MSDYKFEKTVLAYMLTDKLYVKRALELNVQKTWFSDDDLSWLFSLMVAFYKKYSINLKKSLYMETIRKKHSIGSPSYIYHSNIYDDIILEMRDESGFDFYFNEFKNDSAYKQSLDLFLSFQKQCEDRKHDTETLLNNLIQNINYIKLGDRRDKYGQIDYIGDFEEQLLDLRNRKEHPELYTGIKSHIPTLDKYFNGFEKGTLNIVAGMTGAGKSTVMKEFARRQCIMGGKNILIISCEDDKMIWSHKVTSSELKIPLSNLLRGEITDEELKKIEDFKRNRTDKIGKYQILEFPAKKFTVVDFEDIIEAEWDKYKPDIIFVDQISLIAPTRILKDRIDIEYGEITKMLRAMARKFNLPVVAASQVNRKAVKERKGERIVEIHTENISQSDMVGQDADTIFAIQPLGEDTENYQLVIIKQRNGPTNTKIELRFSREICCFIDKEAEIINDVNGSVSVGNDDISQEVDDLLIGSPTIAAFLDKEKIKEKNQKEKKETEQMFDNIKEKLNDKMGLEQFLQ